MTVKFELLACTVDPQSEQFDPAPLKPYLAELGVSYFLESQPIVAEAQKTLTKDSDSFCAYCSRMRRGIVAHEEHVSEDNVEVLLGFDFVFLCLDNGPAKKLIVDRLSAGAMSFIDVGIGVELVPESLALWAICRVTTSTPDKRDHVSQRVSFADNDSDNPYDKNIQVADLNALNAALAVIRWKKLCGFYQDLEKEHNTTYTTSSNLLTSDDLL